VAGEGFGEAAGEIGREQERLGILGGVAGGKAGEDRWGSSDRAFERGGAFALGGVMALRRRFVEEAAEWWAVVGEVMAEYPEVFYDVVAADVALGFVAQRLGWGTGIFGRLVVERGGAGRDAVEEAEAVESAVWGMMLMFGRARRVPVAGGWRGKLGVVRRRLTMGREAREVEEARQRGRRRAGVAGEALWRVGRERLDGMVARRGVERGVGVVAGGDAVLTVVICTHNPRRDVLGRTLEALREQTLELGRWRLLIVDNRSAEPVGSWVDLSWHPGAEVVVEETPGTQAARVRGAKELRTELMVYVDDDNVLAPDYLERCVRIGGERPELGLWGGVIELEFEVEAPGWIDIYRPLLAERLLEADRFSNLVFDYDATPVTAGMCLRRAVAEAYIERMETVGGGMRLGRVGKQLTNGEDIDLAWTACRKGYGMGLFKGLRMTHLIPPGRLEEGYLLRLQEGTSFSGVILHEIWGDRREMSVAEWLARRVAVAVADSPEWGRYLAATLKGERRGMAAVRQQRGGQRRKEGV
jgi:hypothetical protein